MKITPLLSAALLFSSAALVNAETLKWARAGDSLTLDPHAQNEGPTSTLAHQIMEPLIIRDHTGAIEATLVQAENTEPAFDKRGAVLCSYSIVTVLEAYARKCGHAGTDFHVSLLGLLERHRDFVSRNGPSTEEQLDAFEASQIPPGAICNDQDVLAFYTIAKGVMSDFKDEIEKSLSVDRKPVWNPCI